MKVAIDISPIKTGHFLKHRVRGTGVYLENLKRSLLKYHPENKYIFFTRGEKLPKDTDLVHYPYFEPFFRTLPLFRKYKTVITIHDLTPMVFPKEFPAGIRGKIKWQMQKYALKKADAIITDSNSSKKDIVKFVGVKPGRVHVVYLAAGEQYKKIKDQASKIKDLRNKYKLPDKFVLYVGDATWNKNLPRLIQAIHLTDIPLVMVGKALAEEKLDRTNPWNKDLVKVQNMIRNQESRPAGALAKRPEIINQIITLGFVPTEELVTFYNLATVFAMPSLYEGFGLPILEAMSCGCPVVTSKEGSMPEVAGDASFYVDPYNIYGIAKGIEKVFSNTALQKELSEKGLLRAKKFSWEKTARETIKVYEKVLQE